MRFPPCRTEPAVILAGLCEQGVTPNAQAKLDVSALSPNADDLTYSCNVDDGDNVTISNQRPRFEVTPRSFPWYPPLALRATHRSGTDSAAGRRMVCPAEYVRYHALILLYYSYLSSSYP